MKIEIDDLSRAEIHALLNEHLQSMHALSPPQSVHALDLERLRVPAITFWSAWEHGQLLGCGALKELDPFHGEVKSMRTPSVRRRCGAGRAILAHIIDVAKARGYRCLSLETGAVEAFKPAQTLYESAGFTRCGPFGDYALGPFSVFMTMRLPQAVEKAIEAPSPVEQGAPASKPDFIPLEGGCSCKTIRYRLETAPLFVHCCHCRWCQRESGAAFALNAMIESDRVTHLGALPELVDTPSASGLGQKIARCPHCRVAVWSHYSGSGPLTRFVRVGTLDTPDRLPPDVHIFTASRQPWVVLSAGTPAFDAFYDIEQLWPTASLARRQVLAPRIQAHQASLRGST